MQAQARICPICIDDHSEDRECYRSDLESRIEVLAAEVRELREVLREVRLTVAYDDLDDDVADGVSVRDALVKYIDAAIGG